MGTAVCVNCIGICVSVPASTIVTEYYLGSGLDKCLGFALKQVQVTGVCACTCLSVCLCERERERRGHELCTWGQACFLNLLASIPYCWQSSSQSWKIEFLALNSSHQAPLPVSYSVFIFWSDSDAWLSLLFIQSEINVVFCYYLAVWFRPQVVSFPVVFSAALDPAETPVRG